MLGSWLHSSAPLVLNTTRFPARGPSSLPCLLSSSTSHTRTIFVPCLCDPPCDSTPPSFLSTGSVKTHDTLWVQLPADHKERPRSPALLLLMTALEVSGVGQFYSLRPRLLLLFTPGALPLLCLGPLFALLLWKSGQQQLHTQDEECGESAVAKCRRARQNKPVASPLKRSTMSRCGCLLPLLLLRLRSDGWTAIYGPSGVAVAAVRPWNLTGMT